MPLQLLSKFAHLQKVDLGFPIDHFHGRFKSACLPESWKSLVKLNIQSPSLVRQIDPCLAQSFPNLLDLSMTSAMLPADQSKAWVLPPNLTSFSLLTDLLPTLQPLDLTHWNWLALLPASVERIIIESDVSFLGFQTTLRIPWPSALKYLRLGQIKVDATHYLALDRFEGHSTFLNLPHTLETLIFACTDHPPPKSLPRSLRVYHNRFDAFELINSPISANGFLGPSDSVLEDVQFGSSIFDFAFVSPSLLATTPLDRLTSISIKINDTFTVNHLQKLPRGLKRLRIQIENAPPKTAFQLPPHLAKFVMTTELVSRSSPHPILPASLETFVYRNFGELPSNFVFAPHLRKFVSNRPAFSELHSFSMLPPSLTKLEICILPQHLGLENFNPRLLPPNLRTLAILFARGGKGKADWVRWWAHIPQEMPLESLTFSFAHMLYDISLSFPSGYDGRALITAEQYAALGCPCLPNGTLITEPLSPNQLTDMGLPYLHRTLLHLSVNVYGFRSVGLVLYIARNLPPNLSSLLLGPYEMPKLFDDFDLPQHTPTLWNINQDLWKSWYLDDDLLGTFYPENVFGFPYAGWYLSTSRPSRVKQSSCHAYSR